ncbi:response regulator transcription factor [Paenibacillus aestuarii]|uniref:Helix-turn-helix domain-containing protein n=1 Tax=Paenibacillus aestuarii TaxID=516965 RepID=A0ABW0K971_9BACL|nr:helix-turn-helix domain-containing protein [Paenibacillus aestuarii]
MKVMLVDDEPIVIEHIKGLIPWEACGYEMIATATNGKSALRICEEKRPEIVIVDIRMPVMDGVQLIRAVSEKQLGILFIVLSAYEDFSVARQVISLGGVSSYLIKHEIDSHKLLQELNKAKATWELEKKQQRMMQNDMIKDLVTGIELKPSSNIDGMKPPFGLALIQKDAPFSTDHLTNVHTEPAHAAKWIMEITKHCAANEHWKLLGEFQTHGAQIVLLFAQRNKAACVLHSELQTLLQSAQQHLFGEFNRTFSVFYTYGGHDPTSLPASFQQVVEAARHTIFCGREALLCVNGLPLSVESTPPAARHIRFDALHESLEQQDVAMMEKAVKELFSRIRKPKWDLRGLYDTIGGLTNVIQEPAAQFGRMDTDIFDVKLYDPVYQMDELIERFIQHLRERLTSMNEIGPLSGKMQRALRYIHEHYHEEISIDDVSYAIGISPSYLHQLFKKEMDRTFLDYVTEHRIQQAKRILRQEDAKITDVAARIGYRSPQHFTQVFKKVTGLLPHQYREAGSRL